MRSRDNCDLAVAFKGVEVSYDRALKEIRAFAPEARGQVNRFVRTDKHGIALGGIDVAACFRDAVPVRDVEADPLEVLEGANSVAAGSAAAPGDRKSDRRAKKGVTPVEVCNLSIGNLAFARRIDVGSTLFGSSSATFLFAKTTKLST